MSTKTKAIFEYEDAPKPVPLVKQHADQVTTLTLRLRQSDFWKTLTTDAPPPQGE